MTIAGPGTESASKEVDEDENLSETKDPTETKVPGEIKDEAKDRSQL